MLWPIRFALKLMWRLQLILLAAAAGFATGLFLLLREEQRSWGVAAGEAERELPGDDIISDPVAVDTRGLSIDAPPSAVWPWLVQMGYGRGGWYSYDRMNMDGSSADSIVEELQQLSVGDTLPTHPGGGFEARIVEPERALVLYLDTELVSGSASAEVDAGSSPAGLQAAGMMGGVTMAGFRGTWTFVLEPEAGERTRLIERFRLWTGQSGMPQQVGLPLMGMGVFAMTRKHMLGLKERAERQHAGT
jgi:hypothetical protein